MRRDVGRQQRRALKSPLKSLKLNEGGIGVKDHSNRWRTWLPFYFSSEISLHKKLDVYEGKFNNIKLNSKFGCFDTMFN